MQTPTSRTQIARLRVADAMHAGVFTCDRAAPLSEVAAIMARERVHCVVVDNVGEDEGPLWGIVSDLDLVAAATVRNLEEQTAGGSAASPLLLISPQESLERAAQLMTEHAVTHLVAVGPDLRPVGVVSTLDVARVLSSAHAAASPV
jgi:CBS domain-containing protein